MLEKIFSSVNTLQNGLNASWLKNEVISNNIANVDTPGFKTSHVRFEDLMAEASGAGSGGFSMVVTNAGHIGGATGALSDIEPQIVKDESTTTRLDGNNVNIDNEMVELAKNSINYYTTVSKINSEFRKLDTAINVN
jgi:flagellar basal-body rod protein FlgB